jgi:hypothetical protein
VLIFANYPSNAPIEVGRGKDKKLLKESKIWKEKQRENKKKVSKKEVEKKLKET